MSEHLKSKLLKQATIVFTNNNSEKKKLGETELYYRQFNTKWHVP